MSAIVTLDTATRTFQVVHALLLANLARTYLTGRALEILDPLFLESSPLDKNFRAGLNAMFPFAVIWYLTASALNLLASGRHGDVVGGLPDRFLNVRAMCDAVASISH